jgi:hypothetical protein
MGLTEKDKRWKSDEGRHIRIRGQQLPQVQQAERIVSFARLQKREVV